MLQKLVPGGLKGGFDEFVTSADPCLGSRWSSDAMASSSLLAPQPVPVKRTMTLQMNGEEFWSQFRLEKLLAEFNQNSHLQSQISHCPLMKGAKHKGITKSDKVLVVRRSWWMDGSDTQEAAVCQLLHNVTYVTNVLMLNQTSPNCDHRLKRFSAARRNVTLTCRTSGVVYLNVSLLLQTVMVCWK